MGYFIIAGTLFSIFCISCFIDHVKDRKIKLETGNSQYGLSE